MKARHKRFIWIVVAIGLLAGAVALVLNAFNDNLVFFHTPSEVAEGKVPKDRTFRVGGMVPVGSVKRLPDGVTVNFVITDTAQSIPVTYKGALPDLFKEGKGAVAQGKIDANGNFIADQVLAKHDENYMPPEAQDAIDRAHKTEKTVR